jgi:cytochrome c-type biogenesis protein CcmE
VKITPVWAVAFLLVAAGGALAYGAVSSSVNPYLSVSDAVGDQAHLRGEVQVLANLSSWSTDDAGVLHLVLSDGAATIAVTYAGVPPQSLQQGQQVVAIGTLSPDRTMTATRLLTKCPSKYE